MGSISRMNRIERFREEFEQSIVAVVTPKVGELLTVESVYIGDIQEEAWICCDVKDAAGQVHEMHMWCVFDPDYSEREDMIERLEGWIEGTNAEIKARLAKADLFDFTDEELNEEAGDADAG